MIERKVYLSGLASLAVSVATAEAAPLKVRAGEHGQYSRIVIPAVDASTSDGVFSTVTVKDGIVRMRVPAAEYDLSAIIRARKAHRVKNARISGSSTQPVLEFHLNCACDASVRQNADQSIIIDISSINIDSVSSAPVQSSDRASNASPSAVSNERETDIARARAQLVQLLNEADEKGYVNITDGQAAPAPETAQAVIKPAPALLPAPPKERGPAACPSGPAIDILKSRADFNFDKITNLQKELREATAEDRPIKALAIAGRYLQLGLLDEADTIANNWLSAPATDGVQAGQEDFIFLREVIAIAKHIEFPNAIFERDLPLQSYQSSCAPELAAILKSLDLIEREAIATQDILPTDLLTLAPSLRGPLLSRLALIAYNQGDETALVALLHHAEAAYQLGQPSTTVQYLKSVASKHADNAQHDAFIQTLSDTDHPLKPQILADRLSADVTDDINLSPSLLDEVAEHAQTITDDLASRRLVTEGSEALANAGRVDDAINLLGSAARALPNTRHQYTETIGDIVDKAVSATDAAARIAAASAFLDQVASLEIADPDLKLKAAAVAADLGLSAALENLFGAGGSTLSDEHALLLAQAHFNAGSFAKVSALAADFPRSANLAELDLRARRQTLEERGDTATGNTPARATIRRSVRQQIASPALASQAFIAREWRAAKEIFASSQGQSISEDEYRHMLLANYMSGDTNAVRQPTLSKPDGFDDKPLRHFVEPPPAFNPANRTELKTFSQKLVDEITLIETELAR